MKKIFPLFFIFSFSFFISPAQDYHKTSPELNRRVDSLKKVLATLPALVGTDDDTTRMKLCIDIGDLFERVQPDSALWWYSQAIDSLTDKEIGKYRSRAEFIAIAHKYSGIVTMTSGNYSNAITAFEQAKTIFEKLNDKKGLSTCLNNIGIVYYNKGDFHRAMDYYEKSLLIFEELDYQRGISSCLNNLSLVAMYLGDYSKAEESYEKSLKLKEDIDDQPGISRCLNNLGLVVMYQGDYRAATEYFEKSMKIRENLGDKKGISDCLNSLGMVYKYQGDFPKATGFHEKGLNIEEELGDKKGISGCLTNLGNVFADQGNLPKAQEYYEKSLKLYEELGDEQGMAVNLNNLGIVYKNQGNYNKAEEFYSESLKIKEKAGDKMGISNCLSNLGNLYFYRNFWDKAEEFYEKSLIIDEELGDKKGITSDLNSLGSIYYCKGEYLKAEEYYEKSLRLREEIGVVADLLVSYTNLAKVCIQQNIPDRAVNMYRKALEITTVLLKENFSILSEREKEAYLEKTCSIFNQMAEFSLHYTRLEDMRCDCYNDELLLKGLLLNSSCSMMDVVTNSTDSAITSTFWLLTRQRKQISEQLSTPKDERILNVDSLEKVANETERQLVKLSSAFADQQEQFGYKWQDVQKTLQSGEAAIEFVKIKHTILRSDTLKTDSCSYAALLLKPGDIFPLFIALCNEESLEKLLTRGDENDFDLVGRIYSSKTENTLYGLIWKPM
ncbi:MAG: tetratricopeptide repeat protein, partial [Bacteroidetes bacterium]|nr:tetratricopeptide repeat protein [Bacteroidota bacterium]